MFKKNIIISVFFLSFSTYAQYTSVGSTQDVLGTPLYGKIAGANSAATGTSFVIKKAITDEAKVLEIEDVELNKIHIALKASEYAINHFIDNDCMNFINLKYALKKPKALVNPSDKSTFGKNKTLLFRVKGLINKHHDYIGNNFDENLNIDEGDRILNIMLHLEKVIKITLQDEKF